MPVTASRTLFAALLLFATACRGSTSPAAPQGIAGEWTLTELGGQPAPNGYDNRPASLRFENDGAVSGFTGCNRVTGTYRITGESLRFGGTATTRMACPDGMELDRRVTWVVENTMRFSIAGTDLTLFDASGGPIAKFTRTR